MSFRSRYLFTLAPVVLACLVLLTLGIRQTVRAAVRDEIGLRGLAEARLLADDLQLLGADGPQEFAERAATRLGVRVTLITSEGRVIGESSRSGDTVADMDNHAGRPEVQRARTHGSGTAIRRSATTGIEYIYCAESDGADPGR